MDGLQELVEIEAIRRLKSRRVRSLDTRDWATCESLHPPEHVSHGFKGGPAAGPKAMMERLISQVGDVTTDHMVHSPAITLTSATTAEGSWMLRTGCSGRKTMRSTGSAAAAIITSPM